MNDFNHVNADSSPRMPTTPPRRGSPDMFTYQGGMACKDLGTICLGHIAWQSINSVTGMWVYYFLQKS